MVAKHPSFLWTEAEILLECVDAQAHMSLGRTNLQSCRNWCALDQFSNYRNSVCFQCPVNARLRPVLFLKEMDRYYENTPIQIYEKVRLQKFSDKKTDIFFHISAPNIDCGYSLEPPRCL